MYIFNTLGAEHTQRFHLYQPSFEFSRQRQNFFKDFQLSTIYSLNFLQQLFDINFTDNIGHFRPSLGIFGAKGLFKDTFLFEDRGYIPSLPLPPQMRAWSADHQTALETLIKHLTIPPIMAFSRYDELFIVHLDVSHKGLSAVLYQKQDREVHVISYASETLSPAERTIAIISGNLNFRFCIGH